MRNVNGECDLKGKARRPSFYRQPPAEPAPRGRTRNAYRGLHAGTIIPPAYQAQHEQRIQELIRREEEREQS